MLTPLTFPLQGRPGVPGAPDQGPFGQITYTDKAIGIEDSFAPGVRQRLLCTFGLQAKVYLIPR